MRFQFVTLVLCSLLPTLGRAQSSWDRYQPGTVAAIMNRERAAILEHFRTGTDSNIVISGADFATRTTAQYQDSMRATPEGDLHLLEGWARAFRVPIDARRLFVREVLIREDTLVLWLPVQDTVAHVMRQDLHKGDAVLLFVLYLGAYGGRGPDINWVFAINDYQLK